MWKNFKTYFTTEHRLYRKQSHTAQSSRFHAANHELRGTQANMLAYHIEALTMLASATSSDHGTVSTFITTNATLSSHLAEKSAALMAANETICFLRAGSIRSGVTISTPTTNRATSGGSGRVRPFTDNDNYCWSHGFQINVDHTSLTCTRRDEGHQELVTKTNNKGGRQWGRDAA
jgi:hypothetical protein